MEQQMKDSGLPWVGKIPSHWTIERGKNILTLLNRPVLPDDGVITCFRDGEVTLRSNRREEGFTFSDLEIGYQGIEPGDLVVHGMDGFAGSIGISDSRGKATPVLNVMNSTQDKKYLMYFLRCMAYNGVFLALSTGIRVRSCDTNWNKIRNVSFLLPPIQEQQKIASTIEAKCEKANLLISQYQQSIENYKLLKQSVITEAVLKGIRGERPLKDSGILWIGDIPSDWTVQPLWGSISRKTEVNHADDVVLSLYREYGVIPKDSRDDNHNVTSLDTSNYKYVEPGDLVVNKMKAWQGSMAISELSGIVSPAYHVCKVHNDNIHKRYLHHLLRNQTYLPEYLRLSTGMRIGQWDLSYDDLRHIPIVIPRLEEQKEIASFIDIQCSIYDSLMEPKQKAIDELENYKRSIIFEYITGKKSAL